MPVTDSAQSTIANLSARIASLEDVITRQNQQIRGLAGSSGAQGLTSSVTVESVMATAAYGSASSPSDASGSEQSSGATSGNSNIPVVTSAYKNNRGGGHAHDHGAAPNSEDEECALSHYDYDVQRAAVALAQLSLAPADEYVGSGTIPYALNKVRVSLHNYHLTCLNLLISSVTLFAQGSRLPAPQTPRRSASHSSLEAILCLDRSNNSSPAFPRARSSMPSWTDILPNVTGNSGFLRAGSVNHASTCGSISPFVVPGHHVT